MNLDHTLSDIESLSDKLRFTSNIDKQNQFVFVFLSSDFSSCNKELQPSCLLTRPTVLKVTVPTTTVTISTTSSMRMKVATITAGLRGLSEGY